MLSLPLIRVLTDDELLLRATYNENELGSIKITMWYMDPQARRSPEPFAPDKFSPVAIIHEQSKKAGTHVVS